MIVCELIMSKRTNIIIASVIAALVIGAGLGLLIWWLVVDHSEYSVTVLEGEGIGDIPYTAAYTKIHGAGDMFWWFYPTTSALGSTRPIIVWLDGLTGGPPSLLANLATFGPYDLHLNRRNDSWIDQYNLLFIDSPLGTGFSTSNDRNFASNLEEMTNHLIFTVESFYQVHEEYISTPLYIFGQGHGAQQAVSVAARLKEIDRLAHLPTGVVIGNGIISPALALTKLGFYLEELGYIDGNGRDAIENLSNEVNTAVNRNQFEEAFNRFMSLGNYVNENAGAVAVNLAYIVEKLAQETSRDYYGHRQYLGDMFVSRSSSIMDETVRPALGIPNSVHHDAQSEDALRAVRNTFMIPAVEKVEYLLENTNVTIIIYNGNLDAVSNTPGQLEWVNNLQWHGQAEFQNSPRQTLIINGLVEGYFRETPQLTFYWVNVAGQLVPTDNPIAMRRIIQRITEGN